MLTTLFACAYMRTYTHTHVHNVKQMKLTTNPYNLGRPTKFTPNPSPNPNPISSLMPTTRSLWTHNRQYLGTLRAPDPRWKHTDTCAHNPAAHMLTQRWNEYTWLPGCAHVNITNVLNVLTVKKEYGNHSANCP